MATRFDTRTSYAVPPERLLALIVDPEVQRGRALALGALEASCERHEEPDGAVVLTLREREASRWGGEAHQSLLTMRWDRSRLASTWRRVIDGFENRARAEGTARIEAGEDARSCAFVLAGEIEVRVPLIGRMIERKVVEAIERARPREEAFFRERLSQR